MENIREYYLNNYPKDELGYEIKKDITFLGLRNILYGNLDVYEYIGVLDSLIRERLFEKLANDVGQDYKFIYNLWLSKQRA